MFHTGFDLFNPARPGAVPVMGTFAVNLPAIAATTATYSTIVAVSKIHPSYALSLQDMGIVSGASANSTGSTARILFSAQPQDGQITLTFINQGAAVNATDKVFSYLATPLP